MRKRSTIAIIALCLLFASVCLGIVTVELKTGRTIFSVSEWINFSITYLSFCGTMMLGLVSYTLAKTAYLEEQILTKKIVLQPIIPSTIVVTQQTSFGFAYDKDIDVDATLDAILFMEPTTWIKNAKKEMSNDLLNMSTIWKNSSGEYETVLVREKLEREGTLLGLKNAYFEFNLCKLIISFQTVSFLYPCLVELESVKMTTFMEGGTNITNEKTFSPTKREVFFPDMDKDNVWGMPISIAMPCSQGIFSEEGLLRYRLGLLTEDEFRKLYQINIQIYFNIICDNVITPFYCRLGLRPLIPEDNISAEIEYEIQNMKLIQRKKPYIL